MFWTVTAVNTSTGEVVDGPIGSFATLPAGTPIDSIRVASSEWGYFNPAQPNNHPCYSELVVSTTNISAARYPLSGLPAGLELAGARIEAATALANWPFLSDANATIWAARNAWAPCTIAPNFPTPDMDIGSLSRGTVLTQGRLRFDDPVFISHLQRALSSGAPYEILVRADRTLNFSWGGSADGRLRLQYYVTPAPSSARRPGEPVAAARARRPR
jgi:hypothetical protein